VNLQNQRGDTALHLAAYRGFREIVLILTQAGADPFLKNGQSKTPLQEAQSRQHNAASEVLLCYMERLGMLLDYTLSLCGQTYLV
jgi:ankyrin repeat protein